MVSRENTVVGVFVVLAMVLYVVLSALTDLSAEVSIGLLVAFGIVAPMLVNNYLDNRVAA